MNNETLHSGLVITLKWINVNSWRIFFSCLALYVTFLLSETFQYFFDIYTFECHIL